MPLATRPAPPSFSLAKTKITSPLAICLPPYIVFWFPNANTSACGSMTSVLIANIVFLSLQKLGGRSRRLTFALSGAPLFGASALERAVRQLWH